MRAPTTYSLISYGGMVACELRMAAYAQALRHAVTPGCTVIDIGAGPGVFSLLACEYGAGTVIAIEPDDSVALLRQLSADNGYADRITIIQGMSTEFDPPTKADVIISDLRGCLPMFERHIPTIIDARNRLLAPGGTLIPARDTLRIALAHSPEDHVSCEVPWTHNRLGLDLSAGQRFATNCWWKVTLGADALLSEPENVALLDYYRISRSDLSASVDLEAMKAGLAHGLVMWFDAELAPGLGFTNAPGEPPLIYGQAFLPFEQPVAMAVGDQVAVAITADLVDGSYIWGWKSKFRRNSRAEPDTSFQQSSFLGKVISPKSLSARSSKFVPSRSHQHSVDRACLSMFDGQRSLQGIAEELHSQFDQFTSVEHALDHVASLAARYR